jgi:long-chain acyl-CoA synthetase
MNKVWLREAPAARPIDMLYAAPVAAPPVAVRTDLGLYPSLVSLLEASMRRWRDRPAYRFLGRSLSFGQVDDWSLAFAAWLQASGLARGDRVALMLPNVPQYPVAVAAVLRAGMVVVNIDPRCSARELEHRLKDSGARAIVVIENAAALLQQALGPAHGKSIVIAALGDLLGPVRGPLVNHVLRRVRKLVPSFQLPGALRFADALAAGRRLRFTPPEVGPDDIALLQYTGGTTAVSKGAVLLHRQLVANLLQCEAWYRPALRSLPAGEQLNTVCALPLHQIYGFNIAMMLSLHLGGCGILIHDADDTAAMLKELARHRIHSVPGVDAMFLALASHADADRVDWSHLRFCVSGSTALREATARLWLQRTGCAICEGYGLTETGPAVTCNPVDTRLWSGSVGLPLAGTELRLLDDRGDEVPPGTPGEIAIRGPQVMAGYWQRPDDTARAMTADGFFRSGDIGVHDELGHLRLVDRKKDTILVSGFNVYPNEVEGVVTQMAGVLECAAVGMPDARVGEAVKLLVVKTDPASASPSAAEVHAHCAAHLSGYKRPRIVEFRADLPKTAVGKVMRRALREHG